MSVMEYDLARRYQPHNLSFPNYYGYNDRNAPLAISQHIRPDPRGYPIGGSVGSPRGRPGIGREEPTIETGPARRRIAVACARCRKRKIRCSGDPGTGSGCTNCRQAGLDPSVCQFHRVGSDSVHKFHNDYMAHSLTGLANSNNGMMPTYPAATNNQMYARPMTNHTYPQLDTKSLYSSGWSVPYSEDTSPIDTYGLEQTAAYLPNSTPMTTNGGMYGPSCRWSHPSSKPLHQGSNAYYNQDGSYSNHGLPYMQSDNLRNPVTSEALSPLNMSSLSLTLPARPHPRQYNMTDGTAVQRQLPMPLPSPAQASRNVVDQLQNQRLRSGQAATASSAGASAGAMFAKSTLPWGTDVDGTAAANATTSSGAPSQMPTTSEGTLNYLTATSLPGDASSAATASQLQLNFSSSSLLDGLSAPAPATTYSTFREHRPQGAASTHLNRHSSQTSLYAYNSDNGQKRNSLGDSNNCTLVNGQRYTPLPHQQQQQASSSVESLQRESFENRTVPLHRSSMGNLNSSF